MDVGSIATLLAPRCVACGLERGAALCRGCIDDYLPGDVARCARCAQRLPQASAATLCGACLRTPPHFDAAFALGDYAAPLDRMVLALKGRAQLHLAPAFAALFAQRLRHASPWHAVLPLPLAYEQLRVRGFNQSLELARPLARALRLPLRADILLKTRATPAQHLLPLAERQRNVRDAFAVASATLPGVAEARLLVVDDVMTSGATLGAAAATLKQAGAAHVTVAVVARTP